MASVPPCIPCFFGARNLGRVLATLPYFAFSVATFFPHSDGAKSLRFVGSSIRARWRDLRSNWIHVTSIGPRPGHGPRIHVTSGCTRCGFFSQGIVVTLSSLNKSQVELIDAHLLRRRLITLTNKTYQKLASADRSEGAGVYKKTKIWILCCGLHPLTSFLKGFIDILKDFVTFLKDFTDFLKDFPCSIKIAYC